MPFTIPLPESEEPDIYKYDFDKTLNRIVPPADRSEIVYNTLRDLIAAQTIRFGTFDVDVLTVRGQQLPPIGSIFMYVGADVPDGYLFCDGSAVSRETYKNLFGVISTTYGSGDGLTTFNVPDLRGRIPIGVGTGTGGGASGTGAPTGGNALTNRVRAAWAGEETHTLITAEIPAHTHDSSHDGLGNAQGTRPVNGEFAWGSAGSAGVQTDATTGAGGGGAHNVIQPFLTLNFILKI